MKFLVQLLYRLTNMFRQLTPNEKTPGQVTGVFDMKGGTG